MLGEKNYKNLSCKFDYITALILKKLMALKEKLDKK